MNYFFYKRIFDILFSSLLLIILFPIFLTVAISILFTSKGKIFYQGTRTGIYGTQFQIYKFRTMVINAEQIGGFSTAKNDKRLIKFGRFYRKYKLDELPQILNVLKGEMSLVGPRPQVSYYTNKYEGEYKNILKVKPGITDLATIYFSDMDKTLGNLDVDKYYEENIEPKKNKLRYKYSKNISFFLDFKILFLTFFTLIGLKISKDKFLI